MARQAITLAGAFIGAAFGAPQLGFFIGSLVGNAVDPVRIKAPSIGDIAQQTSTEGVACPLYAGTAGGAGNLIYASEPDIVDGGTSSGKGGPEVENPDRAYVTFIIRIGASLFDGPGYRLGITSLIKVWEDEKLVYDVSPTSTILEESAKYAEGFTFYPGDHTQLPDPDLEAIEGVGNVPAYRGRAIFVKKRHDVTDRRGSVPNFRFEVSVNGTPLAAVTLVTDQNYYSGAVASLNSEGSMGWDGSINMVRVSPRGTYAAGGKNGSLAAGRFEVRKYDAGTGTWSALPAPVDYPVGWPQAFSWSHDESLLAVTVEGGATTAADRIIVYKLVSDTLVKVPNPSTPLPNGAVAWALAWNADANKLAVGNASSVDSVYVYPFTGDVLGAPQVLASPGTHFLGGVPYRFDWNGEKLAAYNPERVIVIDAAVSPMTIAATASAGFGLGVTQGVYWTADGSHLVAVQVDTIYTLYYDGFSTLTLLSTDAILGAASQDSAIDSSRRYLAAASGGNVDIVSLGSLPQPAPTLAYSLATSSVESVALVSNPNTDQVVAGTTTFEQVVLATGRRCKVADSTWNLPGLDAKVIRGTVAASQGYTAQDFLNALRVLYPCDGSCHDGKIHILLRGGAVDVELDEQFMVDEDSDLEQEEVLRNGDDKRLAPLRRPARLNLMFPNANVGYTLTKATPPNYGDRGDAVGETSIQVPAVLDEETEAPQLADILDKVGRADAEGEFVRVFPEYLAAKLVTGSIVRLTGGDLVRRMRVETLRRGDGTVRMGLRIDRTHALTSQATAQPSPGWPAPPPSLAGETTFALLNIPGLVDEDDRVGVRIGVCGQPGSAWRGARVDYRIAGDTEWISLGNFTTRAVMGSLSAGLPEFSPYYTDYWHTLQVQLLDDDDLAAVSTAQLLRGGNAAAIVFPDNTAEILQFQTPVEGSPRQWSLTTLPRGRLATTPGPHSAGARFVMLDGTRFVALPSSLIGKALQFRVTSLGNSPETAPVYDFTWTPAHCQREFAPERLELTRVGGTISGTWAARKRFGTDVAPVHSTYFRGYRVTLTDGVTTTVLPDTNETQFSASDAAFTGDITVTVQGVNLITGAGPGTSETI